MKFSDMKYERPLLEDIKNEFGALLEELKAAKTADEVFAVYKRFDTGLSRFESMNSLSYIRNTLDTSDEFYSAEKDYFDETNPQVEEYTQSFNSELLVSPFRAELEKEFGSLLFKNLEIQKKTFTPEIIPDLQEENKLVTEYDKLLASAQIEFRGDTYTLAQLTPFYEDLDRETRRESRAACVRWLEGQLEPLDRIFDGLVKVRDRMAKKMGYKSFTELGYYRMMRNCYDENMVSAFRQQVKEHIVPLSERLKAEKATRIGVPRVTVYDDQLDFLSGNAKPKGTPEEIFAHGKKMYNELSPETAEFFDFMLEGDLFDVLTRKGKSGGGYCSVIPLYKSPFIFANFNGTSGDIDVLTHEAGHAFAFYRAFDIYPTSLQMCTYETAEVHSMSMEFFTWPWMEGFFGEQTGKYRYAHLAGALTFLPYGTMVDEFQHHVYDKPEMTPAERNALWLELEETYRPYLDNDFNFYREGRRWQLQRHIYMNPFYYIDYCLAQTMALKFWDEAQENHKAAWEKYLKFVGFAGTKTFTELVENAELPSPFATGCLSAVAGRASQWLDENPVEDK